MSENISAFTIYYNGNESGDWIVVRHNGVTIFDGHSLSLRDVQRLLETAEATVVLNDELTDEEIMNLSP